MFCTLTIFSLLAVAAQAAVPHFARQTDCSTPCLALSNAVSAAGTSAGTTTGTAALVSLCTSTIMNDYGVCYGCEVQVNGLTQADAQQTVDDFASGCQAAGHPVASITINADGSTSGGGVAPAAPGASPAASSASPAESGASPAASGASPAESGVSPAASGASPAESASSPAASGASPAASGSSGSAPAATKSGAARASTSLAGVACALLFASYASW